jgi:hypothetical protein
VGGRGKRKVDDSTAAEWAFCGSGSGTGINWS